MLEKRRDEDAKVINELRKENENFKKAINSSKAQKELYYTQFGELFREINLIKEDIKKINNNKKSNINDMALRNNDNNKEQIMIKFEKDNIKHDLNIEKTDKFEIGNIIISNIGNKKFENLFFVIDTNNSSKNLSFYQGNNTYNLSLNRPFTKGQNLNNYLNLCIKNPKFEECNIFIYVREKADGENLSSPLKITVNVIGDKKLQSIIEKYSLIIKDINIKEVYQIYKDFDEEYNLSSMFDTEETIKKIIEYKCDREKLAEWIADSL